MIFQVQSPKSCNCLNHFWSPSKFKSIFLEFSTQYTIQVLITFIARVQVWCFELYHESRKSFGLQVTSSYLGLEHYICVWRLVLKCHQLRTTEHTQIKRLSIHSKHASVPLACTDHDTARVAPKSVERKPRHSLLTSSYAFFFFFFNIRDSKYDSTWTAGFSAHVKVWSVEESVEGLCNLLITVTGKKHLHPICYEWLISLVCDALLCGIKTFLTQMFTPGIAACLR